MANEIYMDQHEVTVPRHELQFSLLDKNLVTQMYFRGTRKLHFLGARQW